MIRSEDLTILATAADDIAWLMMTNGGCTESSVGYLRRAAEAARLEAARLKAARLEAEVANVITD